MEETTETSELRNPPDSSALHGGHQNQEDESDGKATPIGRPKAQSGSADLFESRLPDEFFDELRERRGFGRKLTAVRGVAIAAPDPIVSDALREISAKFGKNRRDVEDALANQYLSDVEAVTSRLNARQLPRITRLLLTQRGVYVNLLAHAISKMEGRTTNDRTHMHARAAEPTREKETKSKAKPLVD